jgi:hypothetical protein
LYDNEAQSSRIVRRAGCMTFSLVVVVVAVSHVVSVVDVVVDVVDITTVADVVADNVVILLSSSSSGLVERKFPPLPTLAFDSDCFV